MAMINTTLDEIIHSRDLIGERLSMQSGASGSGGGGHRITVSNLHPRDLKMDELEDMFSDFGKILSLKVVKKRTGDDGGLPVDTKEEAVVRIKYGSELEAEAAAECWNQVYMGGSLMKVAKSKPRPPPSTTAAEATSASLNSSFSDLSSTVHLAHEDDKHGGEKRGRRGGAGGDGGSGTSELGGHEKGGRERVDLPRSTPREKGGRRGDAGSVTSELGGREKGGRERVELGGLGGLREKGPCRGGDGTFQAGGRDNVGRRGGGGGGAGCRRRWGPRFKVTKEDLDRELDEYMNNATAKK